jgi:chemotaxis protein methyltransferase CheR
MFDFSAAAAHLPLLLQYIAEVCCIHLGPEKRYLVEARLGTVIGETGVKDIPAFIAIARADTSGRLRDKIIDAMTTNETLWFRDQRPWDSFERHLFPEYAAELASGRRNRIRVLCAACSTGQEPYSFAMLLDEAASSGRLPGLAPAAFEILAFDISPAALLLASNGRYNQIEMGRGLDAKWKTRYFKETTPGVWQLDEKIRRMVTFRRRNLQDELAGLGQFDLVMCRNVLIYFKDEFKRDLLERLGAIIPTGGLLLLGGSEPLFTHQHLFSQEMIGTTIFYKRKPSTPLP